MSFWEQFIKYPTKSKTIEYGYITKHKSRLIKLFDLDFFNYKLKDEADNVAFVTSPNDSEFQIFGEREEHLNYIKEKERATNDINIKKAVILSLITGIIFLLNLYYSNFDIHKTIISRFFFGIFGIAPLLAAYINKYRLNKSKKLDSELELERIRFDIWLWQNSSRLYFVLPIIIVSTAVIYQFFHFVRPFGEIFDGVQTLGLVKTQVRNGEFWRLITCSFVHANFTHLYFNIITLSSIGAVVLRFASFGKYITMFFISVLIGSIFSVIFLPDGISVGASGGIMGLIGYVLALGIKFNSKFIKIIPPSYTFAFMLISIITAVYGFIGLDFIDNGAHFGGWLGGLIFGFLSSEKTLIASIQKSSKFFEFNFKELELSSDYNEFLENNKNQILFTNNPYNVKANSISE